MPSYSLPQGSSADVRRSTPQGVLLIHSSTGASVVGQSVLTAGALTPGVYVCEVETYDWGTIEVVLKPSAVTGTFAPKIQRLYANGVAVRSETSGSNFGAGAAQTLTLTALNGTTRCRITFTVPGGGSITFAPGTDLASPAALAEYNGQ